MQDDLVFGAFHDEPILTTGSSKRHLNAEAMWRDELLARCRGKRKPTGNGAGWSTEVAVEAYVVTIRGAAGPGADGLIRPLLKQWRAKRCSFAAFSLPAVQSVIRFKWATYARRQDWVVTA